jgi:hypothetical protein
MVSNQFIYQWYYKLALSQNSSLWFISTMNNFSMSLFRYLRSSSISAHPKWNQSISVPKNFQFYGTNTIFFIHLSLPPLWTPYHDHSLTTGFLEPTLVPILAIPYSTSRNIMLITLKYCLGKRSSQMYHVLHSNERKKPREKSTEVLTKCIALILSVVTLTKLDSVEWQSRSQTGERWSNGELKK